MCGIAGYVSERVGVAVREAAVERMQRAMVHRGPDDAGQLSRGPATVGMRRLAIFDPAHGAQPMRTRDGRFTLVFNGAIYNFRALRRELEARGHAFETDCDTEVLLAAWAEWRDAALARLRGMFAFAVWDEHDRTLALARDAFGIKPLYVRSFEGELLFASELNALIASRRFSPEVDPAAIDAYLAYLAVPAPGTIYRGIVSLRPGEWARWREGQLDIAQWWRFPTPSPALATPDAADFHAELRLRLQDTVAAHRLADVPVGAFLSGGLDSAVIVGLMRGSGPLKTFAVGFDEADHSEADAAAETARHYGTQHHTTILTGKAVADELDRFVDALDQPTGDALNTYVVARAAKAGGVTVALSGLGGDEVFGGYSSFRTTPRLHRALRWWQGTPRPLQNAIHAALSRGATRQRKLADLLLHARSMHDVAAHQRRVLSDDVRRQLLETPVNSPPHPELARLPAELDGAAPETLVSAWELRTYMADVLLRDSDVMSMRHSLELRVPFVDRPLIEWLWSQPAHFRFTTRAPKSALAHALSDVLPSNVLRRAKRGFTLPFEHWMHRELKPFLDDTFSTASVERSGWLRPAAVQAMWHRYLQGSDNHEWSRVWSVAVLIAFLNRPLRPA
jgi:asparagine synthase (glutamine-hydrolysing)